MQGKLREGDQAHHVRNERQPRRESLKVVLLLSQPRTARFSALLLQSHLHDHIPCEIEHVFSGSVAFVCRSEHLKKTMVIIERVPIQNLEGYPGRLLKKNDSSTRYLFGCI